MVVAYNASAEFAEFVRQNPIRPGRQSGSARAALERRTVQIVDVRDDTEYSYRAKEVEAIRTLLGVPILKGDELLGVMMIYRLEVRALRGDSTLRAGREKLRRLSCTRFRRHRVRCFMEQEVRDGAKAVYTGVQA